MECIENVDFMQGGRLQIHKFINGPLYKPLAFVTFLLYTAGGSTYLETIGMATAVECAGEILLLGSLFAAVLLSDQTRVVVMRLAALLAAFSIGIALQGLPVGTVVRLEASMILIGFLLWGSPDFFSLAYSDMASKGVLAGLIITLLLAAAGGQSLVGFVGESALLGFGFNSGMASKNFAAITAFGALSVQTICCIKQKFRNCLHRYVVAALLLAVIVLSGSRTTQIVCLFFYSVIVWRFYIPYCITRGHIQLAKWLKRALIFGYLAGGIVGLLLVLNSGTYAYRYRGLTNYLNMYGNDVYHMVLGNGKMAFGNGDLSYVEAVRGNTGYSGTVELPILSVLIKNGIIGLVGYIVAYAWWIKKICKEERQGNKGALIALIGSLLVSAIVENFIVNVHIVYMPLTFSTMWALVRLENNNEIMPIYSGEHFA